MPCGIKARRTEASRRFRQRFVLVVVLLVIGIWLFYWFGIHQ